MPDRKRLHERLAGEVHAAQLALQGIGPAVSIFGGSRVKPDSLHYGAARETARLVSAAGISVLTGGGPGIMEAANQGAQQGKQGQSVGLVITLPFEEKPNSFLDIPLVFEHFASRKVTFCRNSQAFVLFPGGHGTMDELFEVMALVTTDKMAGAPVILYDSRFWQGLIEWMQATMLREGLIGEHSLDTVQFVDHPQDVLAALKSVPVLRAALEPEKAAA